MVNVPSIVRLLLSTIAVATVLSCGNVTDRTLPDAGGTLAPPDGQEFGEPVDEVVSEQRHWEAELQTAYQRGYDDGQRHAEAQPPNDRDCDYYYDDG